MTELPAWYAKLTERPDAPPLAVVSVAPDDGPVAVSDPQAYATAALERHATDLAGAHEGGRNHQLNAAAFSLGRLIAGGFPLDVDVVVARLTEAADACGLEPHETRESIKSGLKGGGRHPRGWTLATSSAPAAVPFAVVTEPAATPDAMLALEIDQQRRRRVAKRALDAEDAAAIFIPPPLGYTWAEFVAITFPEQPWLIDEVLPHGANVTVTAPYKTGKTTLMGELVAALAGGGAFLRKFAVHDVDLGGIALWDYEMNPRQHQAWARALDSHVVNRDRVHVRHLRGAKLKLDTEQGRTEAVAWLKARQIGVWIVDPFARAYLGDENDNSAVTIWTDLIDQLKADAGVHTFVMPVHTGRMHAEVGSERARGATRLDDWPDVRWLLGKQPETGNRYFRASGRDVELEEIGLRLLDDRRLVGDMPSRDAAEVDRYTSELLTVLSPRGAGEGLNQTVIAGELGWSGGDAKKRLRRAVAAGRIVTDGRARGGLYWSAAASAFDPEQTVQTTPDGRASVERTDAIGSLSVRPGRTDEPSPDGDR